MQTRILISFFPALIAASTLTLSAIDAPIVDVTVFPDRAVVTRAASTEAQAGISEIRISGLPEELIEESLQVRASSAAPLYILDVRSAMRFGMPEGIDRLKPLLERQKELELQIDQVGLSLKALRQQREFLSKIENSITAPRTEGEMLSPRQWAEMVAFFGESLQDLLPRIYEYEMVQKERAEELEAVKREIAQTQGAERTRTREVVVRVESEEATEADLTISYTVMNAGWTPQYNIRVRSADKAILLDYQASIRQRSGEDWSNVNLTLSTARPALGGTPPRLRPWLVDVLRPSPAPTAVARQRAPMAMEVNEMVARDEASFRTVEVDSSLTAVNLRVPVTSSIPGDGGSHVVGVGAFPLDGDFFYTLVPRLSPHAFLQTRVTNPGPAPILAGRTTIFLDGNLVGHSRLQRVEPGQEFDLSLGVDEAIAVERKLLRRFVDQRGLISKTVRTRFEFETVVTNRRATPEKIIIKDHVPVSQHERIKVDLIELSGGKQEDDNPGFYEWRLELRPGAKARIPLTFTVEHPEDIDIVGL